MKPTDWACYSNDVRLHFIAADTAGAVFKRLARVVREYEDDQFSDDIPYQFDVKVNYDHDAERWGIHLYVVT